MRKHKLFLGDTSLKFPDRTMRNSQLKKEKLHERKRSVTTQFITSPSNTPWKWSIHLRNTLFLITYEFPQKREVFNFYFRTCKNSIEEIEDSFIDFLWKNCTTPLARFRRAQITCQCFGCGAQEFLRDDCSYGYRERLYCSELLISGIWGFGGPSFLVDEKKF